MSRRSMQQAMPQRETPDGPSGRLILAGAGGAGAWVLTWLTVQLHSALGWALPLVPDFR